MRRLLLVLACAAGLAAADSVTVDSTFSFDSPAVDYGQPPGVSYTDNFFVVFPIFNPSLGTLQSINYSLTDLQTLIWGFNDVGEPEGIPFQVIFSGELKGGPNSCCLSSGLPVDIPYTLTIDDSTTGYSRDISNGGVIFSRQSITASGTIFPGGFDSFVGTSDGGVGFAVSASISSTPGLPAPPAVVGFIGAGGSDFGVLDLTYNYSTTPEPSIASLTTLVMLATVFMFRSVRTSRRPTHF